MNDFRRDDAGQKAVRDAVLAPGLYGPYSREGRYVFIDKGRLATILQKRFAVDTIMQRRDGSATCIEEKIVRWPGYRYKAITLETQSCTTPGRESDGWMVYGEADWLNYAMCQEDGSVVCHIIDFQALKRAFWPAVEAFKETVTDQINKTACRKVPLSWIQDAAVPMHERVVFPTPEAAEIVKAYNGSHYKRRATL